MSETDMNTLTADQIHAIEAKLRGMHISRGLGNEEQTCSVAAINLALSGELTDKIPDCMSPAIGRWVVRIQDAMPDEMRNSAEWRRLLPLAAGTGRDAALEQKRNELIHDWMWTVVLPTVQPIADKRGFGEPWAEMLVKKDQASALNAQKHADATAGIYATAGTYTTAYAAAVAAAAYSEAAEAAYAAEAVYTAAAAAYVAADDADTDAATITAAESYACTTAWDTFNPIKLLAELVAL